jgi:crotonobetainyl-CoA:carnitine CoA-transferase CaiB-like acyl-CoA transferase
MSLGTVGHDVARELGIEQWAHRVEAPAGGLPWASQLPVGTLATDSVAVASLALNLAARARSGGALRPVRVDRARVAASFGSERVIRIDGRAPDVWAPLSGFWRTADGYVRTHANYPHHENALRVLLGVDERATADDLARIMAGWNADDLETAAARASAVVGAVRTADEWSLLEHAQTVRTAPLIEMTRRDGAPPRPWTRDSGPLAGIRVLDLTRVLAGPVAARDLALAGAEVLRVDAPFLPETGWIHLDTGQGKRSTLLDLRDARDRAAFEDLLSAADVLLTGYRPGVLARFGLDADELADRHPGLVTGAVSAWGWRGSWAGRRGFDSVVQAVTGISMTESPDGMTPGALPAQALDHSTGHFLAAAVTTALVDQRERGGSVGVRMSLVRVAHALLGSPEGPSIPDVDAAVAAPTLTRRVEGAGPGSLTYAPPVLAFDGAPRDYPTLGGVWGADAPRWASPVER